MALSSALSALTRLGVGTAGLAFVGQSCLYDVGPGHRAVVFDKIQGGCQQQTKGEEAVLQGKGEQAVHRELQKVLGLRTSSFPRRCSGHFYIS